MLANEILSDTDGWGHMGGWGGGWAWLWGVATMTLFVILIVWLVRAVGGDSTGMAGPVRRDPDDRAREILGERLAKGELTPEEYRDKICPCRPLLRCHLRQQRPRTRPYAAARRSFQRPTSALHLRQFGWRLRQKRSDAPRRRRPSRSQQPPQRQTPHRRLLKGRAAFPSPRFAPSIYTAHKTTIH